MRSVLVICADEPSSRVIVGAFDSETLVDCEAQFECGLERFKKQRYDYTFCDLKLLLAYCGDRPSPLSCKLESFQTAFPAAHIVLLASPSLLVETTALLKEGASGVLSYPLDNGRILHLLDELERNECKKLELDYLRDQFWRNDPHGISKTKSSKMSNLLGQAKSVATTKTTVLLTGESGTGKGAFARLIQCHSSRAERSFVEVHCGAIPDTLLESELFGHEKGSFTGAHRRKLGKFEIAQGGTLFLDEIGTISPALQIKLLQVIQDKVYYRVGGESPIHSDVRLIAASNTNLQEMVKDGLFREDLFYRLNVFPLELPPLRERREDIQPLSEAILERLRVAHLKNMLNIDPVVLQAFEAYLWPGNIRELENVLERAFILETSSVLRPESFPVEIFAFHPAVTDGRSLEGELTLKEARRRGVDALEKEYLTNVLSEHRGHVRESARIAGITPRQLHKLIKKYGIRCDIFRHSN